MSIQARWQAWETARAEWSEKVFGEVSNRGAAGPLAHLAEEIEEVKTATGDTIAEELADCQHLISDAIMRDGLPPETIAIHTGTLDTFAGLAALLRENHNPRERYTLYCAAQAMLIMVAVGCGLDMEGYLDAMEHELGKNMLRMWNKPDADGVVRHTAEGSAERG